MTELPHLVAVFMTADQPSLDATSLSSTLVGLIV